MNEAILTDRQWVLRHNRWIREGKAFWFHRLVDGVYETYPVVKVSVSHAVRLVCVVRQSRREWLFWISSDRLDRYEQAHAPRVPLSLCG